MDMEQFVGKTTKEEFIQGLLMSGRNVTLGLVWEKCVSCPNCLFAKQCGNLSAIMEASGKNPRCGQVVDILLGDLSPDDVSIPKFDY